MNTGERLGNIRFENGFSTVTIVFQKDSSKKKITGGKKKIFSRETGNININIFYEITALFSNFISHSYLHHVTCNK